MMHGHVMYKNLVYNEEMVKACHGLPFATDSAWQQLWPPRSWACKSLIPVVSQLRFRRSLPAIHTISWKRILQAVRPKVVHLVHDPSSDEHSMMLMGMVVIKSGAEGQLTEAGPSKCRYSCTMFARQVLQHRPKSLSDPKNQGTRPFASDS